MWTVETTRDQITEFKPAHTGDEAGDLFIADCDRALRGDSAITSVILRQIDRVVARCTFASHTRDF